MKLGTQKYKTIIAHCENKKEYHRDYMKIYNTDIYCEICEKNIKKLQIYKHRNTEKHKLKVLLSEKTHN